MIARRERTRHLIELGGLVTKAGINTLLEDDRAAIYGLMLDAARLLRGDRKDELTALWRRHGKRALEAETEEEKAARTARTDP